MPLDSLSPDLRGDAQTTDRVRVRLTEELEVEMIDRLLAEVSPLEEAV